MASSVKTMCLFIFCSTLIMAFDANGFRTKAYPDPTGNSVTAYPVNPQSPSDFEIVPEMTKRQGEDIDDNDLFTKAGFSMALPVRHETIPTIPPTDLENVINMKRYYQNQKSRYLPYYPTEPVIQSSQYSSNSYKAPKTQQELPAPMLGNCICYKLH